MRSFFCAALVVFASAAAVRAADTCSAKGLLGGKPFAMTHCAVSYYDDQHSVTIWISEAPISPEEEKSFQISSYAPDRDAAGKIRTMLHISFCPGGGSPTPSPGAVGDVELGFSKADSPMLMRQWVLDPAKDKDLKIEKMSGELKLGGRLAGRVTGAKATAENALAAYKWQIDFDLRLPEKSAAAGTGCGHD